MSSDKIRFETLIEQYHDEIFRYLWRITANSGKGEAWTDPEDLTQEVFLRAYQGFQRLRPDSNYRAWLYKIATNCAYTAFKRLRRHGLEVSFSEDGPADSIPWQDGANPYQVVARRERLASIQQHIDNLPVKQRAALLLRYINEMEYGEIAQVLECSEDSARANVYQAVRRLRLELSQSETE